jgi:hypothetical protein
MNTRQQNWGDDLRLPTFMEPVSIVTETLEPLRRISYPFQNKHLPVLKRGSWFALKRPADRSRTGLLCMWPERQACIFVSNDRNSSRVALLRLRVDPQFYAAGAGLTVFAATMCPAAREVLVEDVLMWKGDDVANSLTFRKRFTMVNRWIEHYCEADARLMGGLQVRAANWQSLDAVTPDGVWEFQQEDAGRKRLMWCPGVKKQPIQMKQQPHSIDDTPCIISQGGSMAVRQQPIGSAPAIVVSALIAKATKGSGPDQWNLHSADGVSLGRALIRTLDVSSALRSCGSTTVNLVVEWNSVFDKWEARAVTTIAAVSSAFFSIQK